VVAALGFETHLETHKGCSTTTCSPPTACTALIQLNKHFIYASDGLNRLKTLEMGVVNSPGLGFENGFRTHSSGLAATSPALPQQNHTMPFTGIASCRLTPCLSLLFGCSAGRMKRVATGCGYEGRAPAWAALWLADRPGMAMWHSQCLAGAPRGMARLWGHSHACGSAQGQCSAQGGLVPASSRGEIGVREITHTRLFFSDRRKPGLARKLRTRACYALGEKFVI
jgi:hypothetical protein